MKMSYSLPISVQEDECEVGEGFRSVSTKQNIVLSEISFTTLKNELENLQKLGYEIEISVKLKEPKM